MTMPDTPETFDLSSLDIAEDKRQALLQLFPEARTEGGKLDFDRLKLALGEAVDVGRERYGMNWPGKAECFKTVQQPSQAALIPCKDESVNFDTTENLIIEGDNLEVLKLLQKSYLGKVKMIYIDPPYNTGNDFIYPDNYSESLQTYLEYTGQVDAEGRKFGTNTDTDGRFHSKWMNMMYPRLRLAWNLLLDDGVMFVSIDDGEVCNLRHICNEIFGEENFICAFMWKRKKEISSDSKNVAIQGEYIVAYSRSRKADFSSEPLSEEYIESSYNDPDDVFSLGKWRPVPITVSKGLSGGGYTYSIKTPGGITHTRLWAYPEKSFQELLDKNRVYFGKDGCGVPQRVIYAKESKGQPTSNYWDGTSSNKDGKKLILDLLGDNCFDTAKPIGLLHRLMNLVMTSNDIIVDFFAGSGTTGHAVLDLNKQDGGNRKFILVQLPEPTGRADYPTIADITKERVRRVIKKLDEKDAGKQPSLQDVPAKQDRGFRVFKLAESNFTPWNADVPQNVEALQKQLFDHVNHIRSGRTQQDILYELLLKSGFPLTTPVEALPLEDKTVYSVAGGAMLLCLERVLTLPLIRAMAEQKPERVVCLDEGFAGNDQLKANAVQIFKTKGVTKFQTV